eukprot:9675499-Karenia_brevis.AAC.1
MPGSILASAAADAGRRAFRVQAGLTRARERNAFQDLDVLVRGLPTDDVRRMSWLNVDGFSSAWVSSWPSAAQWTPDG